jgi:hypothetical protein
MSILIAQHSFLASVQKMDASENPPVFEVSEGLKIKDDGFATKAAKQTNPLHKLAYSQPTMRKFPDLDSGKAAAQQFTRRSRVPRPDTQINSITLCHRYHFASRRLF